MDQHTGILSTYKRHTCPRLKTFPTALWAGDRWEQEETLEVHRIARTLDRVRAIVIKYMKRARSSPVWKLYSRRTSGLFRTRTLSPC